MKKRTKPAMQPNQDTSTRKGELSFFKRLNGTWSNDRVGQTFISSYKKPSEK